MTTPVITPIRALVRRDSAWRSPSRSQRFGRAQWIGAALLLAALVVFVAFVAVLQGAMQRAEVRRAGLHERAVAEAACESTRGAGDRGGCLALLDRAPDAAGTDAAAPSATVYASYGEAPPAAVSPAGLE